MKKSSKKRSVFDRNGFVRAFERFAVSVAPAKRALVKQVNTFGLFLP